MESIVFATHLLFITIIVLLSPSNANGLGFSVDLIHRDSPPSPFHNPSLTAFEHLSKSLRRSHERAHHFTSVSTKAQSVSSELIPSSGAYLMKIALGSPPFTIFSVADTGSDLIWTQCAPCTNCYKQRDPLFNPKKSSSYKQFPCESVGCYSLDKYYCSSNGTCEYKVSYGDKSYSRGTLASETLTLGSNSFPQITFGCGFQNSGTFSEDESGIVGLGGGPTSLVSQLYSSINGKFSYCLRSSSSEINAVSQIHFGNNAVVSGPAVVSTPILSKLPKTYYHLTLEALTVGKDRVDILNSSTTSNVDIFNIIIDSGTTLTYLPPNTYNEFESLVKKAMGGETVADPLGMLSLCYRVSNKPLIPIIRAHFTGATIELKPINTFIQTSNDVICLAFAQGIIPDFSILGNIAQRNFMVGYDLVKKIVSFKPFNC